MYLYHTSLEIVTLMYNVCLFIGLELNKSTQSKYIFFSRPNLILDKFVYISNTELIWME